MASGPRKLSVSFSPAALATLDQIWEWNAERYNAGHADQYIDFLRSETERLADEFSLGKPVPTRPNLSYVIIKRRRKSHGHVAVYSLIGDGIQVLNFYHTAQDWQTRLAGEEL